MAVAAAGPLALPLAHLKTALSQSSTFQSWCSVGTELAALARIHEITAEGVKTRPFALVDYTDDFRLDRVAQGMNVATATASSGVLALGFLSSLEGDAGDEADHVRVFANTVGAILRELMVRTVATDNLGITRARALTVPQLSNPDDTNTAHVTQRWAIDFVYGPDV